MRTVDSQARSDDNSQPRGARRAGPLPAPEPEKITDEDVKRLENHAAKLKDLAEAAKDLAANLKVQAQAAKAQAEDLKRRANPEA